MIYSHMVEALHATKEINVKVVSVWESGDIAPCIPNVGTIWVRAVSFTPQRFYPRKTAPL
jgi:hypothetical protein